MRESDCLYGGASFLVPSVGGGLLVVDVSVGVGVFLDMGASLDLVILGVDISLGIVRCGGIGIVEGGGIGGGAGFVGGMGGFALVAVFCVAAGLGLGTS